MERMTVSLPSEVLKRIRLIAAERRMSMAATIREAVEEKVARHEREAIANNGANRPKPKSFGIFDSGHTDTSTTLATEPARRKRPKPKSIGSGDSGYTDTSELASRGPVPPVSWR